jgi:amino acid transporter
MFIKKDINGSQKRNLGPISLIVIGLGSMIGSGIFVLLGPAAEIAGTSLPYAFLLGGLLALVIALIYGEFTAALPTSGSSLVLLFSAYGRGATAFVISWLIVLGDIAFASVNALGFAYYAGLIIPINELAIAVIAIFAVFLINAKGIKNSPTLRNIFSLLLVLGFVSFVVIFLVKYDITMDPFYGLSEKSIFPIIAATALIYTSFIGYQDFTFAAAAEEVRSPERNMCKALVITVLLATGLFFLISFVAVRVISPQELGGSNAPLLLVADKLGSWGRFFVIPTAILATLSSLFVTFLAGSKELHAISKQGFFKGLQKLNGKEVPIRCLFFITILAIFLVLANSVELSAYLGNTVYLIAVIFISYAVIKLRKKRPYLTRPFKVPLFPLLPIIAIVISFTVLFWVGIKALFITFLWALFGFIFYLVSWIERERIVWIMIGAAFFLLLIIAAIVFVS